MLRSKKHATRAQGRKAEKIVDKLRAIFESVEDFLNMEHEDESVKEAVDDELRKWEDGEDDLMRKLVNLLKRHLAGGSLEEKEEKVEESLLAEEKKKTGEETTEERTPQNDRIKQNKNYPVTSTALKSCRAEESQFWTPEVRRRKTRVFPSRDDDTTVPDSEGTTFGPTTPKSYARSILSFSFSQETLSAREGQTTPSTASVRTTLSSAFGRTTPSTRESQTTTRSVSSRLSNNSFLSRRASRSTYDLTQEILRRSSILDESVVCLGTPVKPPVEVITLGSTPRRDMLLLRRRLSALSSL